MKQVFTKIHHQKFIDYFNIKKKPSDIENSFYQKTENYIKYIKWIPGIKMIGIGNSIAMNSSSKDSDIDLYIVSDNKKMWFVRILVTLIFQLLGVRKTPKKHAGRFCLSFFSTVEGMDFNNFKIENDIYLYFWIIYFKPILNYNNTYELFLEKNNSWADFTEYSKIIKNNKSYIKYKGPHPGIFSTYQEKETTYFSVLNLINNTLKNIFLPKTINNFEKIGKPYGVIINDDLLKFHNGDIREKIKKELI